MRKIFAGIIVLTLIISGCGTTVTEQDLQGKWIYKKVSYLKENPPVIQQGEALAKKYPYLEIEKGGKLSIYSEGREISKGTYVLEGNIIRYEEVLEGDIKRKIPFLIKSLKNNQLTFETMDSNTISVVAQKE